MAQLDDRRLRVLQGDNRHGFQAVAVRADAVVDPGVVGAAHGRGKLRLAHVTGAEHQGGEHHLRVDALDVQVRQAAAEVLQTIEVLEAAVGAGGHETARGARSAAGRFRHQGALHQPVLPPLPVRHQLGTAVLELRRQVFLEHGLRLDDMAIGVDDHAMLLYNLKLNWARMVSLLSSVYPALARISWGGGLPSVRGASAACVGTRIGSEGFRRREERRHRPRGAPPPRCVARRRFSRLSRGAFGSCAALPSSAPLEERADNVSPGR